MRIELRNEQRHSQQKIYDVCGVIKVPPDTIYPGLKKKFDLMGRRSSTSRAPATKLGPNSEKILLTNDLPTQFVKLRDIAVYRNKWRAVCGSQGPSATKETCTSSRLEI
jgi:hypothetical protein